MTDEIQIALTLLLVGMITVFSILTLVVLGGKALIAIVHRFSNESQEETASAKEEVDEVPIAILSAVVQVTTAGRGRIIRIDKIN